MDDRISTGFAATDPIKVGNLAFANPFTLTLKRSLETIGMAYHVFAVFLSLSLCLYIPCYMILYTKYWWIWVIYAGWLYYDLGSSKTGGYGWKSVNSWRVLHWMKDYFPLTVHKSDDSVQLSADRNYICGIHPHGIMAFSAFLTFGTDVTEFQQLFPGIETQLGTLVSQFLIPFRREYYLMGGKFYDVSKEAINYVLTKKGKGQALCLVLGGAREVVDTEAGIYDLTLANRKGFVKLALMNGADLVPVFSFGENELFYNFKTTPNSWMRKVQDWVRERISVMPLVFSGRGIFFYTLGVLPYRHPVDVVIGRPIPVEQCSNPTQEQIDKLHQQYMNGLVKLFEDNKCKFGLPETAKINFVY